MSLTELRTLHVWELVELIHVFQQSQREDGDEDDFDFDEDPSTALAVASAFT